MATEGVTSDARCRVDDELMDAESVPLATRRAVTLSPCGSWVSVYASNAEISELG